jgi:hypothetical protein
MEQVKPICVIYLPYHFDLGSGQDMAANRLMTILNGWDDKVADNRKNYWEGYLWFCFPKHDIDAPAFVVYHPKDFTEIQFQELKDMVMKEIKNLKQ